MGIGTRLGITAGVAGGIVAGAQVASLTSGPHVQASATDDGESYPYPYDGSRVDPATDYPTYGDQPIAMPVRAKIDPPGWLNDYDVDGVLDGSELDADIDPRGWWNTIHMSGSVDGASIDTELDRQGWGGVTRVRARRDAAGDFRGTVDRPGIWNGVRLDVHETARGAQLLREGRFDEPLTPGLFEASWRSYPTDSYGGSRTLEFNVPGWANTTKVSLEGNVPAGVETTIAAHLFDEWKSEQEAEIDRINDYPNGSTGTGTSPGDL